MCPSISLLVVAATWNQHSTYPSQFLFIESFELVPIQVHMKHSVSSVLYKLTQSGVG